MLSSIVGEIKKIIKEQEICCSVEEFQDRVNWEMISAHQQLSEGFIREFQDRVIWNNITAYQKLSEDFIREFQDRVNWYYISMYQKLSKDFIREFQDRVNWAFISKYQKLSEDFIREFQDRVDWDYISVFQKLSEEFIREFQDRVNWESISESQKLSEEFIREFKERLNDAVVYFQRVHSRSVVDVKKEMRAYAKQHNLRFDGEYLYAYREHDENGCGAFNKTVVYEKGKYYRDWHCDLNKRKENSFGLGVWPRGNVKVRVAVADWGIAVSRDDGKARVWGFEIL